MAVSLATLLLPPQAAAQQQAKRIDQITAAFVLKFASYVEWPSEVFENDDEPIIIGVVGSSPVGAILAGAVEGKKSGGRPMLVRAPLHDDDLLDCHILYFAGRKAEDTRPAIERLGRNHVLTVSRASRFAREGGIIELYTEDNKVRFEVNIDAAGRAGLKISSRLLGLAKVVWDEESSSG